MAEVSGLWIYPIKSCRGIECETSLLTRDGLAWDRHWMLVDTDGRFLTQRQFPGMALIGTALGDDALSASAPGMSDIEIPLESDGERVSVTVWRDTCSAIDTGDKVARWFSDVVGVQCRLVAFDGAVPRLSDTDYAGDSGATSQFSDGFSMLVVADASLTSLNERLVEKGVAPAVMRRFRPNLTIEGLDAFDEDHVHELRTTSGIVLRIVKPCARCIITTVDPYLGVRDRAGEPLATLNEFRASREHGTVFGQNAIVIGGAGKRIARGEELAVDWNF
ncbi:MAG TPA: MOSC N-terminal beta barrel domain-containing protein [Rhodocyclaceae bacterium]|nr:MOSC N-terminal beta barrel domain-containing protein [Rhodocyclaceae bacterium]HMV53710.1 MOSC N-terminal beta barrel domain-containing protein [Rhodocyclaceae bacterium]HMZ84321.1 MOSC N-terminal beta barrel domain-containing protein [Rhodocyclaceae bacterium]HNA03404.1 MOSC N-terminal beta barrel domain-containing protein [Rhodocyclaceae bacterium]HNB77732.1 MOSC N-terminal beta barrel domain-containing protein [Rhodocyclaceae bacterium]